MRFVSLHWRARCCPRQYALQVETLKRCWTEPIGTNAPRPSLYRNLSNSWHWPASQIWLKVTVPPDPNVGVINVVVSRSGSAG